VLQAPQSHNSAVPQATQSFDSAEILSKNGFLNVEIGNFKVQQAPRSFDSEVLQASLSFD